MDKLIAAFPSNITEAITIAQNAQFQTPKNPIHAIVICGMGGSGIGGKLVAQWVQNECRVPIICCQDYTLPAFVGQNTLVIGSSYSGNTEETLFAVKEAKQKGAHIVGISSGGQMADFCRENNYDCVIVPGGNPPRTAIAYSLVQLTSLFVKLRFVAAERLAEIEAGRALVVKELTAIQAEAHTIAKHFDGKVPIVYASAAYEALTMRVKQQLNENSKMIGWQNVIPEMNHNELVGWGGGDDRFAPLFIQTGDLSPRNQKRFEISMEIVQRKTSNVLLTHAKGNSTIEKSIYLIHLLDWASLYVSDLKNGDPIEIVVIDYLKDELGKMVD